MILFAVALALFLQDPPPGDVIVTSPPSSGAPTAGPGADPPAPPARPVSTVDFSAYARDVAERYRAVSGGDAPTRPPAPLPPEAFGDPVRYATRQCRTGTRPAGEDVAACLDRVDRAVREQQDRRDAPDRQRVRCENGQTLDEYGRVLSTFGRCAFGAGDSAPGG